MAEVADILSALTGLVLAVGNAGPTLVAVIALFILLIWVFKDKL